MNRTGDPAERIMNSSRLAVIELLVLMVLLGTDCSRRPGGIEYLGIEKMENGYLFRLRTEHQVGDVSAFVGPGNWVLITVADSTLDTTNMASLRSGIVDSLEIQKFESAFQLSLHLKTPIGRVEVVHRNPSNEILISLFRNISPNN